MGSSGSEIRRLADDSIRRIVAEQAITDLSSLVKELVDNALDAESTLIKIRLFGQGLDIVEVSDDGSGVPPESRPHLAERYATSKIASFEDIYSGTGLTMGFRGEALFSMACLSAKLVVATRTEDEEMAQKLEFKRDGSLDEASVQNIHRKVGTTVAVIEPFAALPARRVDMMRRIKQERTKLFRLMEAYAIFNIGVQLNLIDMSSSGREDIALATSASSTTLEDTVSSVLGHKFLVSLAPIDLSLDNLLKRDENLYNWGIQGLFSKNPRGEMPNRTVNYFSINGRVVEMPKVTSLLRRIWNGFGGRKKPSCILTFTLPNDAFDINLSPDKQQVLLTHEQEICQLLEEHVTQFWSKETQGVFELQQLEAPVEDDEVDDDGEHQMHNQMHKRRFAFVHDLAKAKLQHDSDERQRFNDGEEKKQTEPDLEPSEPGTDVVEDPPAKRVKVSSGDDDSPGNLKSAVTESEADGDLEQGPVERISDMERRNWTAIRSRFNAGNGGIEISQSAPVSPDDPDPLQPEENIPQRPRRVSGVAVNNGQRESRNRKPMESGENQKQTLLQQFAFQPAGRPVSARPTRERNLRPASPSPEAQVDDSRKMRRSRFESQDKDQDQRTKETVQAEEPSDEESTASTTEGEQDDLAASTEGGVTNEEDKEAPVTQADDSVPKLLDKSSMSQPEPVVWTSFRGTANVCRSARMERLQMMRRKLDLRGSRQRSSSEAQEMEGEAMDVTNSVGVAEAPRPSSISLSKEQFRNEMQVIGQFNMGFILARCKKNHLWILDQHACDEKYNFENLCRDTVIHEQKLIRPLPLDVSPAEEACILDNMNIFEANGFRFHFDSSAPVRQRLSLTALPHSGARDGRKAVQFGKDDVITLCSIIMDGSSYDGGDGGTGVDGSGMHGNNAVRRYASTASSQFDSANKIIARLPKAIAMFASRACRSSIMIGTALSQKEMEKIVRRLADVEYPWNCPHGRPTMRHVGDLHSSFLIDERNSSNYFTDPTITVAPMTQEATMDENQEN